MFTRFFERDFSVAISQIMLFGFVALLPFIGGCGEDDNPIVDEHDHEEEEVFHADADGFVLEVDGSEVYRQFQGTETGGLTLGVGDEIEVDVAFLDPNGAEFHVGEEEEEGDHDHDHDEEEAFALGLTGYDSAIIDIHLSEEEHAEEEHEHEEHGEEEHEGEEHEEEHEHEEHGEEGHLHFEVVGLKAGTTEIRLQLLHGDHPDFTAALPIPVTVQ